MSSTATDGQLLGVVLLGRHGDREGFYQDPKTYTPANTAITALGSQEEIQLGTYLQGRYLNSSSPSFIKAFDTSLADDSQFAIRADAGGEQGVIFSSVVSMLQGLFPPTSQYNTTLANGTTVVGPLNGYQTIPIESVEVNEDVSLEGWLDCNTFNNNTAAFYNSTAFAQKASASATFLTQLVPYLSGRPATLENMWNIFDFMNVQSIHNATFASTLPAGYLAQARDLANWHENNVFSSPTIGGIGNIGGTAIVPSILNAISDIVDPTNPLKLLYEGISYKPFISLFTMTGATQMNPQLFGVVNYAAAIAYEIRAPTSSGGEPTVRFMFKNGTDDAAFVNYNIMNSTNDIPLSKFISTLSPVAVNNTATWCSVCDNTQDRGCAALTLAKAQGVASVRHPAIGSVGAGFLGAGLTLIVAAAILALLLFFGVLVRGNRSQRASPAVKASVQDSESHDGSKY